MKHKNMDFGFLEDFQEDDLNQIHQEIDTIKDPKLNLLFYEIDKKSNQELMNVFCDVFDCDKETVEYNLKFLDSDTTKAILLFAGKKSILEIHVNPSAKAMFFVIDRKLLKLFPAVTFLSILSELYKMKKENPHRSNWSLWFFGNRPESLIKKYYPIIHALFPWIISIRCF